MKILVFYLIIINIFTFLLYGLDKWKAKHHRWRISESALLLAALVGGSVGALSGMYGFHHKTLHKKFTIGVPIFLIVQEMHPTGTRIAFTRHPTIFIRKEVFL